MNITTLLGFAGALNVLVLAIVTALSARKDSRAGWLAAGFAAMSAIITVVLISHATAGTTQRIMVLIEEVVTLASGPVILHYLRAVVGRGVSRVSALTFVPAAAYGLGAPLVMAAGGWDPLPPVLVIGWLWAFTAAAAILFFRERKPGDRTAHGFYWPVAMLATLAVVHVAQAIRLLGVAGGNDRNLVALVAAISAFGLLLLALTAADFVERAGGRYVRSGLGEDELKRIYRHALAVLEDGRLHRRTDLSLAQWAQAAGAPERHLTQAISRAGGTTFNALIASRRAEDAAALMADPALVRAAVEALGMEAGFGSRSAFYTAFHKRYGSTPAEYRRKIVSAPRGADTDARESQA